MLDGELAGQGIRRDDGQKILAKHQMAPHGLSEPGTSEKLHHLASRRTSPFLADNIEGGSIRINLQALFNVAAMVAARPAYRVERSHTATQFQPRRYWQTKRFLRVGPRAKGVKVWVGFCQSYGDRPELSAGGEREYEQKKLARFAITVVIANFHDSGCSPSPHFCWHAVAIEAGVSEVARSHRPALKKCLIAVEEVGQPQHLQGRSSPGSREHQVALLAVSNS